MFNEKSVNVVSYEGKTKQNKINYCCSEVFHWKKKKGVWLTKFNFKL